MNRRPFLTLAIFAFSLMLAAPNGFADQRDGASTPTRLLRDIFFNNRRSYQRNHWTITRAFAPVVQTARESTVRILSRGRQVALGTIVDTNGFIVTKASQLEADTTYEVDLGRGRKTRARRISEDRDYDVALLKVNAANLRPVTWSTVRPAVGAWLATADANSDQPVIAVGVLSVAPRQIPSPPTMLGVNFNPTDKGPVVTQVRTATAAEHAGLQVNDYILAVDGESVRTGNALPEKIGSYKAGERIQLTIERNEITLSLEVVLGHFGNNEQSQIMDDLGGNLSNRRIGFPLAFQHDSVLKPNQCGGPIVDLEGHVIGINIARSSRVASYAIPSEVLRNLIPHLQSSLTQNATVGAAD